MRNVGKTLHQRAITVKPITVLLRDMVHRYEKYYDRYPSNNWWVVPLVLFGESTEELVA